MTNQDQIVALAELDGFVDIRNNDICIEQFGADFIIGFKNTCVRGVPNYITSYDAIIPLVQEQSSAATQQQIMREAIALSFRDGTGRVIPTPRQLCEALLRATGKWKE